MYSLLVTNLEYSKNNKFRLPHAIFKLSEFLPQHNWTVWAFSDKGMRESWKWNVKVVRSRCGIPAK